MAHQSLKLQALYHQCPLSVTSFCKSHHPKAPPLLPASVGTYVQTLLGASCQDTSVPCIGSPWYDAEHSWHPNRGTPCSCRLPSHTSFSLVIPYSGDVGEGVRARAIGRQPCMLLPSLNQHPCPWCLFRQPQLYVYCICGVPDPSRSSC